MESLRDECRSGVSFLVAGSVCKDYSTMGKQLGLNGQYVMIAAIMMTVVAFLTPSVFMHECTRRFPNEIFTDILKEFVDFPVILNCPNFGCPVKRSRAYDLVIHKKYFLPDGLSQFHRLATKCTTDAGIWLQADDAQALCFWLEIMFYFLRLVLHSETY